MQSLMNFPEVSSTTGNLSRTTIWRLERAGQFPKRLSISPGRVAWVREEVEAWVNEQAERRVTTKECVQSTGPPEERTPRLPAHKAPAGAEPAEA